MSMALFDLPWSILCIIRRWGFLKLQTIAELVLIFLCTFPVLVTIKSFWVNSLSSTSVELLLDDVHVGENGIDSPFLLAVHRSANILVKED